MRSLLLLAAALTILAACSKDSHAGSGTMPPVPAGVSSHVSAAAQQAKNAIASTVAEFQRSSRDSLPSVDGKIAELQKKASAATESAKAELEKALADLDEQRKALDEKISELSSAAPEKAEEILSQLKSSLAGLKKTAEDAAARFR
jgi:septal ring factor EnvC (AmiA/AmiB activator)